MSKTETEFVAKIRIRSGEDESPETFRARCEDFIKELHCLSGEKGLNLKVNFPKLTTRFLDDENSIEE